MPKYSVYAVQEERFEVEAENQQEAYDKAYSYMTQIGYSIHASSWNYEIEEIEEEEIEEENDIEGNN